MLGQVVLSKAGKDSGSFYAVVLEENKNIVNGNATIQFLKEKKDISSLRCQKVNLYVEHTEVPQREKAYST